MEANYSLLNKQLDVLTKTTTNNISILANVSALLFHELSDVSWVGFYLYVNNHLELGPFQGKVACTVIPFGKGVCGTSIEKNETILVPNVHEFPGHIACDSESNSEIVIPIHLKGNLYGVLDIDSTSLNRFTNEDKVGLELLVKTLKGNLK
ncbi:MAG: GAF domain-containing protein [Bacilli bacterium]|nr:GAF domain-containing protein [Bacilli bacterium]